ncbi:protein exportin 1b [Quercus suber]|uniref:Protein exportin 1b n=1 Tax=Quercus suber TaxID=58331 RepID=A0AAW0KNB5_QUESU
MSLVHDKFCIFGEFQLIHEFCLYVLSASQRTELIRATLSALHAFLSWIPLGYIFESPLLSMIETLLKSLPSAIIVSKPYPSLLDRGCGP